VDFLIEDRKILSQRRPVNCFHGTHRRNLTTNTKHSAWWSVQNCSVPIF
jgi:hypothetical protein